MKAYIILSLLVICGISSIRLRARGVNAVFQQSQKGGSAIIDGNTGLAFSNGVFADQNQKGGAIIDGTTTAGLAFASNNIIAADQKGVSAVFADQNQKGGAIIDGTTTAGLAFASNNIIAADQKGVSSVFADQKGIDGTTGLAFASNNIIAADQKGVSAVFADQNQKGADTVSLIPHVATNFVHAAYAPNYVHAAYTPGYMNAYATNFVHAFNPIRAIHRNIVAAPRIFASNVFADGKTGPIKSTLY